METVNIVSQFSDTLVNRNVLQGDGKYNGEEFREKFLAALESDSWWNSSQAIELNFKGVETIGPSWANEVFAYYTRSYKPAEILKKIKLINISPVKMRLIQTEIDAGYRGHK